MDPEQDDLDDEELRKLFEGEVADDEPGLGQSLGDLGRSLFPGAAEVAQGVMGMNADHLGGNDPALGDQPPPEPMDWEQAAPQPKDDPAFPAGRQMQPARAPEPTGLNDWMHPERMLAQQVQQVQPWQPQNGFRPTPAQRQVEDGYQKQFPVEQSLQQQAAKDAEAQRMGRPYDPSLHEAELSEIRKRAENAIRGAMSPQERARQVNTLFQHMAQAQMQFKERMLEKEMSSMEHRRQEQGKLQRDEKTQNFRQLVMQERERSRKEKEERTVLEKAQAAELKRADDADKAEQKRKTHDAELAKKTGDDVRRLIDLKIKAAEKDAEKDDKPLPAELSSPDAILELEKSLIEKSMLPTRIDPQAKAQFDEITKGMQQGGKLTGGQQGPPSPPSWNFKQADEQRMRAIANMIAQPNKVGLLSRDADVIRKAIGDEMDKRSKTAPAAPAQTEQPAQPAPAAPQARPPWQVGLGGDQLLEDAERRVQEELRRRGR